MKERLPEAVDYAICSTRLCQSLKACGSCRNVVIAILLVILVVYLFCKTGGHPDPYAGCPVRSSARLRCSRYSASPSTHCQCWAWSWLSFGVDEECGCRRCAAPYEEGLAPKDAAMKAMKELSGTGCGDCAVLASVSP